MKVEGEPYSLGLYIFWVFHPGLVFLCWRGLQLYVLFPSLVYDRIDNLINGDLVLV